MEALGRGLSVPDTHSVFRCNLATVVDGILVDPMAGKLSAEEAVALIDLLNGQLAPSRTTFHLGSGHRHLMICPEAVNVQTVCPYTLTGRPARKGRPKGPDADRLAALLELAGEALAGHAINQIRRELGESPITQIWPWDGGPTAAAPSFKRRFSLSGGMVTGEPMAAGVARHIGWEVIDIPQEDGYTAASLAQAAQGTVAALEELDVVCVHVGGPDVAALKGDSAGKIAAIEAIDEHLVRPVFEWLQSSDDEWRMLIAPTFATHCGTRQRHGLDSPFAMAGAGVRGVLRQPLTEANAAAADLHVRRGDELMEFVLTVR
jgi:2,3-bisphosphoglycerate-independent phosphoglycerate mutase